MMTDSILMKVKHPEVGLPAIAASINAMAEEMRTFVPGYELRVPPVMDGDRVTVVLQIEGQGDFLPKYSGNLDIINAAAIATAERIAKAMLEKGE